MNLKKALSHADFSIIEGNRKCGKLTFFLHFLNNIADNKQATIITSANQGVFLKKINIFKESIAEFKGLDDQLEFFFLKDGWKELLKRFDHDFLLKDIGRIVEKMPGKNLFIDNIGEMFDLHEQTEIPKFIKDLHNLGQLHKKNIFVTLSKNSDSYQVARNILLNYLDIIVAIQHSETVANIRQIDIPVSNYPLEKTHFEIKLKNQKLTLSERTPQNSSNTTYFQPNPSTEMQVIPPTSHRLERLKTKDNYNILLISNSEHVSQFHHYIFGCCKKIQLTVIKNPMDTPIETLSEPDIIIFNADNVDHNMDLGISETVKKHKLNSELFYLCSREHAREQEKIKSHLSGFREFFTLKTRIINYVLALEKSLHYNFYSSNLITQSVPFHIANSRQEFKKQVKKSLKNRNFFTLFSFTYDKFKFSPTGIKGRFRDDDYAFIDHDDEIIYLYCNNAQKENSNIILRKLKKMDSSILLQKSIDAVDLFFNHKKIF